ncbi:MULTISPECIES: glycosyltransferase family 4 protein [unclassified Microbacterium]|uniref:glycosyltransferase family 4 protein n=1 Tax=unclassified Microbacterium TaxID=2609290 RepID=UPI000EA89476|nr:MULTISPECIES: glycosyltransferase family 4 protein [unclassified Microbacterium]MBT2484997.1 glycosyltransferase family 4 protein [Microbacterium sp. ISL-108]RKN67847.1 glycosyltransferase WbuB [Microbacterium sp. CGR2]
MKVLIVSQYYPPEAVPLPADLAQGLAARGHHVKVLTGFPNYPSGKVFPGYRQAWRSIERDGTVEIHRVPLFADHSQSAVKRMLNYFSFALSSATAARLGRGADVIYVYATQMTAGFGPWLWRITGGRPYVLHVQDLWPDSIVGSSMMSGGTKERVISGVLGPWLRSAYRRANGVIGIAPTMVSTLVSRGVPDERAHLVYNWADAGEPVESTLPAADEPRAEIVYAGNIGDMQDLSTAVRAAHAAADAGVALTLVGDGVVKEDLQHLVAELGAENVRFHDPVPRERMPEIYARADYALVSLKDMPVFRGTIPSKFQAVLSAGVPVITTVQGDVRHLVEDGDVGLTADAEDARSLEAAFRDAAARDGDERAAMARRGRTMYDSLFSRESGISRIEELLTAATKETGTRR